jgi:hypothetical protein
MSVHVAFGSTLLRLTPSAANLIPRHRRDGKHYTLALVQRGKRFIQHLTSPKRPRREQYEDLPQFRAKELATWHADVAPELFFDWACRALHVAREDEFDVFVPREQVFREVLAIIDEMMTEQPQAQDLLERLGRLAEDDGAYVKQSLAKVAKYGVVGSDGTFRPIQLAAAKRAADGTTAYFLVAYFPLGMGWRPPGWYATPADAFKSERIRDLSLRWVGARFWNTMTRISSLFGGDDSWIDRLRYGEAPRRGAKTLVDTRVMAVTTVALAASKALPAVALAAGVHDEAPHPPIPWPQSDALRYRNGRLVGNEHE